MSVRTLFNEFSVPLSKFQQDTNLLLPTVSVLTGTPGGGGGGGAIDAPGADPGGGGGGGGGGAPAKGWRSKIRWSSGIKDQRSNVPVVVVVEGAVLLLREWVMGEGRRMEWGRDREGRWIGLLKLTKREDPNPIPTPQCPLEPEK